MNKPIYLDCNATTPVDPRVAELVMRYMVDEFGNAGSRTHEFGMRAKHAVQQAREQVAQVAALRPEDVIFTSGATESNNLALLGLAEWCTRSNRRHIISTQIEHKAVLEPLDVLAHRGFTIDLLSPTAGGWIDPDHLREVLREDTGLVSTMHVNNETGVIQPLDELAAVLEGHHAYWHVDAAQGYGKIPGHELPRIDLLSVSAHKIFGPKGIGALLTRRRGFERPPLTALHSGGGQEKGLRPGTLPVALIVGLGLAAELANQEAEQRRAQCSAFGRQLRQGLERLGPAVNGDPQRLAPHTLNVSFPGIDSEAVIVATKNLVAVSNGSACTSNSYQPSHVLNAMGLPPDRVAGATRFSWCHLTPSVDWDAFAELLRSLGTHSGDMPAAGASS